MTNTGLRRLTFGNYNFNRIVIPILLLALCAWVGQATPNFYFLSFGLFELVVGALGLGLFLFLALRNPQLGLIAIVFSGLFIHFGIGTGSASRIPATMVLTLAMLAVWVAWMFLNHKVQISPSRSNLPLIGFILASVLSLPWGYLFWTPEFDVWRDVTAKSTPFLFVQIGGLLVLVLLPILFLISSNILSNSTFIKRLFLILIAKAVSSIPVTLLHLPSQIGLLQLNTTGLYPLWIVSLLYAQILFNDQLQPRARFGLAVLIAFQLFLSLFNSTSWISGWSPTLIAVFFLTFLKSRKLFLLLSVIGLIVLFVGWDFFYLRVWVKAAAVDFNRFTIWPTIISLITNHASLILGAGPATYQPLSFAVFGTAFWSAHNNFVDIFAQTGLVGLFFLCWFFIAIFRTGFQSSKTLKDGFLLATNNGVLACVLGSFWAMFLGDWVLPFVYNQGLAGFDFNVYAWIFFGVMVGLARRTGVGKNGLTVPLAEN